MSDELASLIDALLPQTQCGQCGYTGCLPYAQALANDEADINRCPPGGDAGIRRLAQLLGKAYLPLDPACGEEKPRQVAVIAEADCIGCTKCLPACPVDAIVGANKHMHTVIAGHCTGCGLCVAPCPVDCIRMEDVAEAIWDVEAADKARLRYQARNRRLQQQELAKVERLARQKQLLAKLKRN